MMPLLFAFFLFLSPLWPLGDNPRVGDPMIIVNKQTNQLAFIRHGKIERIYRVATGKTNALTPEGLFTVTVKAINPYYRKKNIPGGAPNNPLGTRWIGFDARGTDGRTYGIHGTNRPSSIGRYITEGCVRMHNRDVEALYPNVPIGTKVAIVKTNESFQQLGKKYGALK